jgi:uncharacterized MAPEG superfamily protein
MSIELKFLVWSVALAFVQMLLTVTGAIFQVGLPTLAGNRDKRLEYTGWVGRSYRAIYNMLENLALFVPPVLAAQIAGRTNATTARGAEIFFFARLAYAGVYLIGIPYLRTLVWGVSLIGLFMLFSQLV